ncbi:MFS transporter, partial [Listeria monocytogenes]|nr:MFS transporter [Listeria monocytogenes]
DTDIMNKLVNPQTAKYIDADILLPLRKILYDGLHSVYLVGLLLVIIALVLTLFVHEKSGKIKQ